MPPIAAPIDASLAIWDDDEPQLLGGRCRSCDTVSFPRIDGCPRCGGDDVETTPLSRRGTLWTWTTQDFPLKAPFIGAVGEGAHEPFLLGYVELPEGVLIEGWLLDTEIQTVAIGQTMELATFDLATSDQRGAVRTFGFRPVEVGA